MEAPAVRLSCPVLPTWWQRSCWGYVAYWLRDVLPRSFLLSASPICWILWWTGSQPGVPRPAGIALVLGGTLGTLALFLVLVLPSIATDVAGVIQELPTQLARLWTTTAPWLDSAALPSRIPRPSGSSA